MRQVGKLLIFTAVAGITATAATHAGAAKYGCPPKITYPAHGEVGVPLAPRIEHDKNSDAGPSCNVAKIRVEVWKVEIGEPAKAVFARTHTRSGWNRPGVNELPQGKLEPNTRYRVKVTQHPKKNVFNDQHRENARSDDAWFYTVGGIKQRVILDGACCPGNTAYAIQTSEGANYVTGPTNVLPHSKQVGGVTVTRQDNDRVSGGTAQGHVGGGRDAVLVRGDIAELVRKSAESANLRISDVTSPSHHPGSIDYERARIVRISGDRRPGRSRYSLAVEGNSEVNAPVRPLTASIEPSDGVNASSLGRRATGAVDQGVDSFLVAGPLQSMSIGYAGNSAAAFVDGKRLHTVVIDGSAGSGGTGYKIRAEHAIHQSDAELHGREVSIQRNDFVRDTVARGEVGGGLDGYYVLGDVAEVSLGDAQAAEVYVDGYRHRP